MVITRITSSREKFSLPKVFPGRLVVDLSLLLK